MRVFTLGTGNRHPLDFNRILTKYGVEVIFDIRCLPLREPGFDRDALQRNCDSAGVGYVFLGNELGADLNPRAWTDSEPVVRWLGIIRRKLEQRAVCLLCRELSPEHCRRRALAEKLAGNDVEIVHIIDERQLWQPVARTAPPVRRPPHPQRPAGRPPRHRRRREDERRPR